jgi:hypothetical protein
MANIDRFRPARRDFMIVAQSGGKPLYLARRAGSGIHYWSASMRDALDWATDTGAQHHLDGLQGSSLLLQDSARVASRRELTLAGDAAE